MATRETPIRIKAGPVAVHPPLPGDVIRGYRFLVCSTQAEIDRALDVRRRVYRGGCGYAVPVPDPYDGRSWLLLAEDETTGEAVGTLRVTPRSEGPVEAEEYITLPASVRARESVEISRFAILPEHRKGLTGLPGVSVGLFSLATRFLLALGIEDVIICSKPTLIPLYEALNFRRTGDSAAYTKLGGALHELMHLELPQPIASLIGNPMRPFLEGREFPEVRLPSHVPQLGLEPAALPLRKAVGA